MQSLSKYYRPHFLGENDIWRLLINALSFKDLFRVKIGATYNFLPGLGNTPPHVAIGPAPCLFLVSLCLLPTNQKRCNIHIINFLFRTNLNLPIFLAHLYQYRLIFLSWLPIITTFFSFFFYFWTTWLNSIKTWSQTSWINGFQTCLKERPAKQAMERKLKKKKKKKKEENIVGWLKRFFFSETTITW